MIDIRIYKSEMGVEPFSKWIESLRSSRAKARVFDKLDRMERGNLSNSKPVGNGVHEVRINYEKGYRLYFGNDGQEIIVLLCGSHKGDQDKEIKNAK